MLCGTMYLATVWLIFHNFFINSSLYVMRSGSSSLEGIINIFNSFMYFFYRQNPNPDCEKPPSNAQELEECDMSLEDSTTLCRFNGNTMKATHVVRYYQY